MSRHRRIHTVRAAPDTASLKSPHAAANPTAAAIQMLAAVTSCLLPAASVMAPLPRNPIPVEMAAPMRDGSPPSPCNEVSAKIADPKLTRLIVRIPAFALAVRRSIPISAPHAIATPMRDIISTSSVERGGMGRDRACAANVGVKTGTRLAAARVRRLYRTERCFPRVCRDA
ncbi:unnamed protein product [Agarophyton chilense]